MRSRSEASERHERGAREARRSVTTPAIGTWFEVIGPLGVLCIAAVLTAVIVSSCGSEHAQTKSSEAQSQVVTPQEGTQNAAAAAMTVPLPAPSGRLERRTEVQQGLPPDLSVSVPDTSVGPGQAVEFSVEATGDVTQIAVSDGSGDPLPMVLDEETGEWKVQYRVPLKPRHERIGLSVTARNDANRWRRVWVFLHVTPDEAASAEADESPKVE